MSVQMGFDALLPPDMARRAEYLGVRKAEMPILNMLGLAVLAGAFIALGAAFATVTSAGSTPDFPYGVTRMLVGVVFSLGLILIIVGGAELFTGNILIVMAWASRKVTTRALLRNWSVVYIGNFIGAITTAVMIFIGKQYTFGAGSIGFTALSIANGKVHFTFIQAVTLGVMCNAMVCLAVWMTYSAHSTIDKILSIIFPIAGFVAAGFEHSIANMYFVPIGLLIKTFDPVFAASTGLDLSGLTWGSFLIDNLIPVTIGNIIGGAVLVASVYWFIFLRPNQSDKG